MASPNSVRLFEGKFATYTQTGSDIDRKVTEALRPIFIEHLENGIDIRDIEYVALQSVNDLAMTCRLTQGMNIRKQEKG